MPHSLTPQGAADAMTTARVDGVPSPLSAASQLFQVGERMEKQQQQQRMSPQKSLPSPVPVVSLSAANDPVAVIPTVAPITVQEKQQEFSSPLRKPTVAWEVRFVPNAETGNEERQTMPLSVPYFAPKRCAVAEDTPIVTGYAAPISAASSPLRTSPSKRKSASPVRQRQTSSNSMPPRRSATSSPSRKSPQKSIAMLPKITVETFKTPMATSAVQTDPGEDLSALIAERDQFLDTLHTENLILRGQVEELEEQLAETCLQEMADTAKHADEVGQQLLEAQRKAQELELRESQHALELQTIRAKVDSIRAVLELQQKQLMGLIPGQENENDGEEQDPREAVAHLLNLWREKVYEEMLTRALDKEVWLSEKTSLQKQVKVLEEKIATQCRELEQESEQKETMEAEMHRLRQAETVHQYTVEALESAARNLSQTAESQKAEIDRYKIQAKKTAAMMQHLQETFQHSLADLERRIPWERVQEMEGRVSNLAEIMEERRRIQVDALREQRQAYERKVVELGETVQEREQELLQLRQQCELAQQEWKATCAEVEREREEWTRQLLEEREKSQAAGIEVEHLRAESFKIASTVSSVETFVQTEPPPTTTTATAPSLLAKNQSVEEILFHGLPTSSSSSSVPPFASTSQSTTFSASPLHRISELKRLSMQLLQEHDDGCDGPSLGY